MVKNNFWVVSVKVMVVISYLSTKKKRLLLAVLKSLMASTDHYLCDLSITHKNSGSINSYQNECILNWRI